MIQTSPHLSVPGKCDSCGAFYDPKTQPGVCPHDLHAHGLRSDAAVKSFGTRFQAEIAARDLESRLRNAVKAIVFNDGSSADKQQRIRETDFKIRFEWDRYPAEGPAGEFEIVEGWHLYFRIPANADPVVKGIVADIPDRLNSFPVTCELWS